MCGLSSYRGRFNKFSEAGTKAEASVDHPSGFQPFAVLHDSSVPMLQCSEMESVEKEVERHGGMEHRRAPEDSKVTESCEM